MKTCYFFTNYSFIHTLVTPNHKFAPLSHPLPASNLEQLSLPQCVCAQSCPTLCHPMDCSPSGSSVHGISQARILEWVSFHFLLQRIFLAFPIEPASPALAGRFFTTAPPGKPFHFPRTQDLGFEWVILKKVHFSRPSPKLLIQNPDPIIGSFYHPINTPWFSRICVFLFHNE